MNFKLLFPALILVSVATTFSCKQRKLNLKQIEGKRIEINSGLPADKAIESFINPFRNHIEKDLDSVLAIAMGTYSKTDGELNTAIGNFIADLVASEAGPVFEKRTNHKIDAVILNHGGIRAIIPKGPITSRTAFNVMPFENEIVVVGLKGSAIFKAVDYLTKAKRAHPIAGLNLVIDENDSLVSATIKGKNIEPNKTYHIATSDYLFNGGDSMFFFQMNESSHDLDYKIRNAIIDHLKKVDTINPIIDHRFIRK